MSLHVESFGSGKPLVMLHGWGMHGGIWGSVVAQLADHYQVHCVDLPGYGASSGLAHYNLDAIVQRLMAHFSEPVSVCGWSLGGQAALRWAQLAPHQVDKLVLVATTPRFVQCAGWDCAMAAETFREFADAVLENYTLTLKRFIALQVRGSEHERALLAELRGLLFSRGKPEKATLCGGLEILRDTDLRDQLGEITQAALVIAGERDTLTPPAASAYLAQAIPNARLVEIKGAAHVPFLSHTDSFVKHITEFMHE